MHNLVVRLSAMAARSRNYVFTLPRMHSERSTTGLQVVDGKVRAISKA